MERVDALKADEGIETEPHNMNSISYEATKFVDQQNNTTKPDTTVPGELQWA